MATYYMEARTRSGVYLGTLPFRNLQGEFWRNRPKQLRWDLPLYHPNVTRTSVDPGATEIWLLRNDVKVFVGPLWDATASSDERKITCSAESVESYLSLRRITNDLRYTGNRGATAWDLINRAQTGTDAGLGIIQGTINTTPSLTTSYLKNDGTVILDAIDGLSNDSDTGFDWEIDVNRAFQVYYPRPAVASRVRLEWGGAIHRYSVQVMGKWEANDIFVKGKDKLRSQPVIDTAKRAYYGLRQRVESNTNITAQVQLNNYAQRLLSLHRDPREIPQVGLRTSSVNPFEGDIWYGQTAPVVIDDGWVTYDQTMRCDGFQLTVGKNGSEIFTLYMSDLRDV